MLFLTDPMAQWVTKSVMRQGDSIVGVKRKSVLKQKKSPAKPKQERCMVCKVYFDRLTQTHLKTHGFTTQRYRRVYGGIRAHPRHSTKIPIGSVDDEHRLELVGSVAENIANDKVWVACIADEVGERMLTGPLRHRLSTLLTTMLAQRARVQGESLAILNGALGKLREEWRYSQGGLDGAPTDTDTLLRIVDRASKLVKDSEDAVMRTVKLALDEQRTAAEFSDGVGPTLFSGDSDKLLGMPKQLSAGDRETMRGLLGILQVAAQHDVDAVNTVHLEAVTVSASDPTAQHDDDDGVNPPVQVPAESSHEPLDTGSDVRLMYDSTDPTTDPLAVSPSPRPRRRHRKKVDSDSAAGDAIP